MPASNPKTKVSVTFTSDNVCPWCRKGKIELAAAMASLDHLAEFDVAYKPWLLRPKQRDTTDSHRLARWAQAKGLEGAVVDKAFEAHFDRKEDLSRLDTLLRIADELQLEGARDFLLSDQGLDQLSLEIASHPRFDLVQNSGVPWIEFETKEGSGALKVVPGAQGSETFKLIIGQLLSKAGIATAAKPPPAKL